MKTYTVLSDNCVLGPKGDTVSELGGCNVDALVAAGHLGTSKGAKPDQSDPDPSTAASATDTKEQ